MNKRARLNYIHALSTQVEHKKMYKAKKQWVVAGISFLVATGMGAVGNHLTTHAAQVTNNGNQVTKVASGATNNSPKQATSGNIKSSAAFANVDKQASGLHKQILANNKPSLNSSYESYMKQNPQLNKAYDDMVNHDNASKDSSVSSNASTSSVKTSANSSSVSNISQSNNHHGMNLAANIKDPSNIGKIVAQGSWSDSKNAAKWYTTSNNIMVIHDGIINNSLYPYERTVTWPTVPNIKNLKKIIVSDVQIYGTARALFAPNDNGNKGDNLLQNVSDIDVSGLDTSAVTSMNSMFWDLPNLKTIEGLNNFNTQNVEDMKWMFEYDTSLSHLDCSSFDTHKMENTSDGLSAWTAYDGKLGTNVTTNPNFVVPVKVFLDPVINGKGNSTYFGLKARQLYTSGTDGDISVPKQYKIINPNHSFSYAPGNSDYVAVKLAESDAINSDINKATSDENKVSALASADAPDSFASGDITVIDNAKNTIDTQSNSISGYTNDLNPSSEFSDASAASADLNTANNAYDSAYSANADIERLMNSSLSSLNNLPVEAFISSPSGLGTTSPSANLTDTRHVTNVVKLGTYGNFNKNNSLDKIRQSIPNGYHMKPNKFYGLKKVTVNGSKPLLTVTNTANANSDAQSDTLDIYGNPVEYKGTITLHFSDGNGHNIQNSKLDKYGDITLNYDTSSSNSDVVVGNKVNLLNYLSDKSLKSVSAPNDFLGQTVKGFGINGFSYVNSDSQDTKYGNQYSFQIPSDANGGHSTSVNTINNGNITLNFKAASGNTETINYTYNGHNEGSARLTGNTDAQGDVTAKTGGINNGWHLANADNYFQFVNGSSSSNVNVLPNPAKANVQYTYKGNVIASDDQNFHGNYSQDTNASDTSTNVTSTNESGIPVGYKLADNSTNIPFDNSNHSVDITPIQKTDTIDYTYNGNQVGSTFTSTGNDYQASSASDTTFDITKSNEPNLPSGYKLTNKDNNFSYDGENHSVVISPNTDTDIIDYNYGNQTLGNHDFSGNDKNATSAGNNSFDVTSANDSGIPAGYHLANKDNNFNYDNQTHTVQIDPNQVSDVINYQYNGKTLSSHKFSGYDYRAKSAGNNSVDVTSTNDPDIPAGYQLVNGSNSISFDNGTHDVAITPKQVSDTIQYVYNGTVINQLDKSLNGITGSFKTAQGNDISAKGASDTRFTVNTSNLDPRFKVNSDNLTFNYDGGTHSISVVPEVASIAVYYKDQAGNYINNNTGTSYQNESSDTPQLIKASDLAHDDLLNVVSNQSINIANLLKLPNGYHLGNQAHSASNEAMVVLDKPFYSPKGTLVKGHHVLLLTVHLGNVKENTSADSEANAQINTDSSVVNSESGSATSMMSNSTISGSTKDSINSASSAIASASSAIHNDINGGTSAESNANDALASASSAYSGASSLASSVTSSVQSSSASVSASASATSLANLISNDVNNATKNNKPVTVPTSLTSSEVQSLANEISGNIVVKPVVKPNISEVNTTETIDNSALTNLASEVATNNQEIGSLANKPSSANTIDYNYFNNLINSGVSQLTDAINTEFKANLHHSDKDRTTTAPTNRVYTYLKWLRIVKPLKLYSKHGVAKVIKPRHRITLNVKAAYKVHNHIIFKISYRSHNYFIKANNKAIKNAYLPATEELVGRRVRIIYNVYANKHKVSGRVKTLHRGYVGRIKNIVRIGSHNVTRIQLADGLWISANMNYVKVL